MILYNSLTRRKEKFKPIKSFNVGMYTCGPTVYDYASIGNFRTYITADVLVRTLETNGYKVKYVMNITDVGHLTGDNLGNADIGEDKIEKAAKLEQKTAWDIAEFYTNAFFKDFKALNLREPDVWARATDHIKEQIQLIKQLEEKGFTYKTSDGIYFDTKLFEAKTGKKYGDLSTLDEIKEGARVSKNPEKHDARDFALWKFSKKPGERHMEWKSPWGLGFPGWHIECSAMSMKYLGETFDIHVGGEDLRQIHHPNEIAQSEAATGKAFVNYWIHIAFLLVEGQKMSKSLGNFFTLSDIQQKGFDPLALRYLYLTAHYRSPLNFTWETLAGAQKSLERLQSVVHSLARTAKSRESSGSRFEKKYGFRGQFLNAISDDLNTPQALAVLWDVVKSNIPELEKRDLLLSLSEVLGLDLSRKSQKLRIPKEVQDLVKQREELRKQGKFEKADQIRDEIRKRGYKIEDTNAGTRLIAIRLRR